MSKLIFEPYKTGVFTAQMIGVSVIGALGLWGFDQLPEFKGEVGLGWWSLVFFILFSTIIFWRGRIAAMDDKPQVFTSFSLLVTMFKMLLAVLVVFMYKKTLQPTSAHFLGPFFFIYFLFTAFETIFLTKIGKQRKYQQQDVS